MLYKTDIITFKVSCRVNGQMLTKSFDSFSAAAGAADALKAKSDGSIFLDLKATNPEGTSSVFTSLYKYDKKTNTRVALSPYYIKLLMGLS